MYLRDCLYCMSFFDEILVVTTRSVWANRMERMYLRDCWYCHVILDDHILYLVVTTRFVRAWLWMRGNSSWNSNESVFHVSLVGSFLFWCRVLEVRLVTNRKRYQDWLKFQRYLWNGQCLVLNLGLILICLLGAIVWQPKLQIRTPFTFILALRFVIFFSVWDHRRWFFEMEPKIRCNGHEASYNVLCSFYSWNYIFPC